MKWWTQDLAQNEMIVECEKRERYKKWDKTLRNINKCDFDAFKTNVKNNEKEIRNKKSNWNSAKMFW